MPRSSSQPCARTRNQLDAGGRLDPTVAEPRPPNSQILLEPIPTKHSKRSQKERQRPAALDIGLSPFEPPPQPTSCSSTSGSACSANIRRATKSCSGSGCSAPKLPQLAQRRPQHEDGPPHFPALLGSGGMHRRPSNEDSARVGPVTMVSGTPTSSLRRTGLSTNGDAGTTVSEGSSVNSSKPKMTEARRNAFAIEWQSGLVQGGKSTTSHRVLQRRHTEIMLRYVADKDEVADLVQYPETCKRIASAPTQGGHSFTEPSTPASTSSKESNRASRHLNEAKLANNAEAPLKRCLRRHKTWNNPQVVYEDSVTQTTTTPSSFLGSATTMSLEGDSPVSTFRQTPSAASNGIIGLAWKKGPLIGTGSYGTVHRAMSSETGRIFAVKQANLDDSESDRKLRDRLESELEIFKGLSHPNVISYLGHEHVESKLYIYLEYAPGGSIANTLKDFGAFGPKNLSRGALGMLEGLDYLHTQKPPVVHRDIKGANVLVDLNFQVKLADFGCSKRSSDTRSLTTVGSVPWMAPEVILQKDGHGRKADLWSLGCTVIEMATAEKPWGANAFDNVMSAVWHIGMSKATPPLPKDLGLGLDELLEQVIQRNPDDRPSTQQALQLDAMKLARKNKICPSAGDDGNSPRFT